MTPLCDFWKFIFLDGEARERASERLVGKKVSSPRS